jgi:hypothetical protein
VRVVVHHDLLLVHQSPLDLVLMIYFRDLRPSDLLLRLEKVSRIDMLMFSRVKEILDTNLRTKDDKERYMNIKMKIKIKIMHMLAHEHALDSIADRLKNRVTSSTSFSAWPVLLLCA